MDLSQAEKDEIKALVDRGEPLPEKYRWKLFAQPRETELIWPGKTGEVTNVILPFQSIEHVDEPRVEEPAAMDDLFAADARSGRQTGGWTNKLIWGDNKLVLSSLKGGPLRRQIEDAGGLKLVYIDPPFDVGADFSFEVEVGANDRLTKEPSVIEDIAYRDTWGRGADSFLSMIRERIRLIFDLMAADGSIFVHCDFRVNQNIRAMLDEVVGVTGYRNEIIWKRRVGMSSAVHDSNRFGNCTDTIFFYAKSDESKFNVQYNSNTAEYKEYIATRFNYKDDRGRLFQPTSLVNPAYRPNLIYDYKGYKSPPNGWMITKDKMEAWDREGRLYFPENKEGRIRRKSYADELKGMPVQNLWQDIFEINSQAAERVDYPTQKPEALLERIILSASNTGDLVADLFCGSGTTLVSAEKLGRKWIGCDLGRFAIHTSRKRLIGVQRELKKAGKPYRSFEILNLGKYERQYFIGIDPTLPEMQRRALSAQKEEQFTGLILNAYRAERVTQSPPFHGRKGSSLIVIGPIDAPVTEALVAEAVDAARNMSVTQVDILGFEFEMGLIPRAIEDARARGVRVAARYIPKDVFDKRAVEKNQITFFDVAYLDVTTKVKQRSVTVTLSDFAVSYRQEDADALAGEMKPGGSKVTVDGGQVVKLSKDRQGAVTREVLTKKWEDWIDYWSVDFDYHSKQEIITVTSPDAAGVMHDRPQWTGGYVFENEWQSFRTRSDRKLELTSAPHEYPAKGRYFIAVKVIDIFGNDTTKVVEVVV